MKKNLFLKIFSLIISLYFIIAFSSLLIALDPDFDDGITYDDGICFDNTLKKKQNSLYQKVRAEQSANLYQKRPDCIYIEDSTDIDENGDINIGSLNVGSHNHGDIFINLKAKDIIVVKKK